MDWQRGWFLHDHETRIFMHDFDACIHLWFDRIGKQMPELLATLHGCIAISPCIAMQDMTIRKPAVPLCLTDLWKNFFQAFLQRHPLTTGRHIDRPKIVIGNAATTAAVAAPTARLAREALRSSIYGFRPFNENVWDWKMHEIGKWIKLRAPTCNHKNAGTSRIAEPKRLQSHQRQPPHRNGSQNHESLARIREMENSFSKPA